MHNYLEKNIQDKLYAKIFLTISINMFYNKPVLSYPYLMPLFYSALHQKNLKPIIILIILTCPGTVTHTHFTKSCCHRKYVSFNFALVLNSLYNSV